jgi:hypothetical protein
VSKAGIIGPSFFGFRTIVPECPVRKSFTVTWKPSFAAVVNQWIVTVSPAFMISGSVPPAVSSFSRALKPAGSWKIPGVPVCLIVQTGEQTV